MAIDDLIGWTYRATPFAFGGTREIIGVALDEYGRVSIGAGYYGLVVQNAPKACWHLFLEKGGALIGTAKSRRGVIKQVKEDVQQGSAETLAEQAGFSKTEAAKARMLKPDEFFNAFTTHG